ncbi:MAG: universal stress protein [Acidobacteria bacterium]|nr:universal stress protein [Acidobacteriota bacterium]
MMVRISRLLVATDLCPNHGPALKYAISLARRYDADLFIQHIIPDLFTRFPHWATIIDVGQAQQQMHESVSAQLRQWVPESMRAELEIKEIVGKGSPADEIIRFAAENAIDLIIIGTRTRKRTESAFLGSVTERVIRGAPCPVLTIPPHSTEAAVPADIIHPIQLRAILFPTDFSNYSQRALDYAIALSDEYNSKLILLSVVEYANAIQYEMERANLAHNINAIIRWSEMQLNKIIPADLGKRLRCEMQVLQGSPYQEILKAADDHHVDLIVMGAHGWSAIRRFFLGTTTEKVIRQASCPVLTVKF